MELRGATASHVGNVRDSNQDRVHFRGYTGVVADGMGGHQGGEMAASIAISEFVDVVDPIAPGGLVDLVEEANRAVFEKAADPDLRGMGTTLVALTLRPTEEKISIVNVGDSRAYFLRSEEFGQLTLDHSLVEDLVRQKRLTPEEALTHPQRNILTRALGIASQVEVDRFLVPTVIGDRFLLCSDGLFNEVSEQDIVQILRECPEPNDAADRLVAAALAAAGRDNVTVAVIDVVPEGKGEDISTNAAETLLVPAVSTSGAGAEAMENGGVEVAYGATGQGAVGVDVVEAAPAIEPEPEPYETEPVYAKSHDEPALEAETETLETDDRIDGASAGDDVNGVVDDDDYDDHGGQAADDYHGADYDDEYDAEADYAEPDDTSEIPTIPKRKRRRGSLLRFVALFVLGALTGAAYVGVGWWANSQWYVDVNAEQQITVFRGRPEGFLWTSPTAEVLTREPIEELTSDAQNEVRAQKTFESEADALDFVRELEREPAVTGEDLEAAADDATAAAAEELEGVADELDSTDDPATGSTTAEETEGSADTTGSGSSSGNTDEQSNDASSENTGN